MFRIRTKRTSAHIPFLLVERERFQLVRTGFQKEFLALELNSGRFELPEDSPGDSLSSTLRAHVHSLQLALALGDYDGAATYSLVAKSSAYRASTGYSVSW